MFYAKRFVLRLSCLSAVMLKQFTVKICTAA